jgi:hypothetical protein
MPQVSILNLRSCTRDRAVKNEWLSLLFQDAVQGMSVSRQRQLQEVSAKRKHCFARSGSRDVVRKEMNAKVRMVKVSYT